MWLMPSSTPKLEPFSCDLKFLSRITQSRPNSGLSLADVNNSACSLANIKDDTEDFFTGN